MTTKLVLCVLSAIGIGVYAGYYNYSILSVLLASALVGTVIALLPIGTDTGSSNSNAA